MTEPTYPDVYEDTEETDIADVEDFNEKPMMSDDVLVGLQTGDRVDETFFDEETSARLQLARAVMHNRAYFDGSVESDFTDEVLCAAMAFNNQCEAAIKDIEARSQRSNPSYCPLRDIARSPQELRTLISNNAKAITAERMNHRHH